MKKTLFNRQLFTSVLGLSLLAAACGNNAGERGTATDSAGTTTTTTTGNANTGQMAMATLSGLTPDTTVTGTVSFMPGDNGQVKMNLEVVVPKKANQSVAVHIHENGDCGNNGEAAGGHWNPTNENHGKWGEGAFHSGDIGNVSLDGSGKGTMEVTSDRWSVGGEQRTNILNKAIIVHGGVDDYASQPSGNAGNRIGCGVIMARNQ